MNTLELGVLIEQAVCEINDREFTIESAGEQPDGEYHIVLVIDKRKYDIAVNEIVEGA